MGTNKYLMAQKAFGKVVCFRVRPRARSTRNSSKRFLRHKVLLLQIYENWGKSEVRNGNSEVRSGHSEVRNGNQENLNLISQMESEKWEVGFKQEFSFLKYPPLEGFR